MIIIVVRLMRGIVGINMGGFILNDLLFGIEGLYIGVGTDHLN